MNICVYILGRIPPTRFVSSARWSPILQAGWPWCHSMQMVCTEYAVCVECTVCLLWKKLHRIKYINITKRPVEQWEGGFFFIVRHSIHYQIGPGILRFSVHILLALLVPLYLWTKIPLWLAYTLGINSSTNICVSCGPKVSMASLNAGELGLNLLLGKYFHEVWWVPDVSLWNVWGVEKKDEKCPSEEPQSIQ